ncbi:MAG: DUF4118 domain-containing protein, partial [Anaerolineales bacterium]|nr:DUF4118 domain-containing protein [Anaerolineales bacterium]
FFYTQPYYQLAVSSPAQWVALVVFLLVAVISGQQAGRLRSSRIAHSCGSFFTIVIGRYRLSSPAASFWISDAFSARL